MRLQDVIDAIQVLVVFASILALGIVFLAVAGCSTKSVNIRPTLEPTYQVSTNENGELEIIVQAKSRDLGMAISKAQFEARQEFAKHLRTNYISGARVAQQQFDTDESGIYHIATVRMVMPKR
tara:strand:+ start:264 stop:632 length:369 start_codon:yes stop_codon:yes gene_type:complete